MAAPFAETTLGGAAGEKNTTLGEGRTQKGRETATKNELILPNEKLGTESVGKKIPSKREKTTKLPKRRGDKVAI